jgi:hypothetical protein
MIVNGKTLYTQKFSQGDNGSIYGTGTYSMGTTSYILPKSGIVDFKITGGYVVSGEGWTAVPIPGQTNYYYRVYPYNN